jgi:nitrous oxidase accessory protein
MGRYQTCKVISFSILFLLFFCTIRINGKILEVKKNAPLSRISDALQQANSFDTIIVNEGHYSEGTLTIRKPVVLIGKNKPVIDGETKYQIISVMSSHVVIDGLILQNGGRSSMNDIAGIKIYLSKNVIIRNNTLSEMFFGIYFQECSQCIIENNTVHSSGNTEIQSGNGIHCWKSNEMTIRNNNVSGQRDGIYFEFVTNSTITENISENNIRYGLHFMFSHNNTYTDNIFRHNGAGVAVMYTHNVTMIHNTFIDNWGSASYGLLMKDISDSHVQQNSFASNTIGIYMEGSSRIKISNNNFNENGYALKIQASCDNDSIQKNNFISNTFDVTTNGSVSLNFFDKNYWDKYDGYDINRDGFGDVPHRPVNLYSMIIERMPTAMVFLKSFMVNLLDKTEKAIPSITPENFKDEHPSMKIIIPSANENH